MYDPTNFETNEAIANDIAREAGYDDFIDMAHDYITDSSCPSYCFNCGEMGADYEQDQTEGWCNYCEQGTCVSVLVLGGLV